MKKHNLVQEFSRYVLVGGTAFVIDVALLYVFKNYVFYNLAEMGIYISAAIGFIGGLIFNYTLSLFFVFTSAKKQNKGKTIGAFLIFSLIGVVGLLFTELGMYIGIKLFAMNYLIVKILVAGAVLIWNYGIRKILIFR